MCSRGEYKMGRSQPGPVFFLGNWDAQGGASWEEKLELPETNPVFSGKPRL